MITQKKVKPCWALDIIRSWAQRALAGSLRRDQVRRPKSCMLQVSFCQFEPKLDALYNVILRIARNFLETRENIKKNRLTAQDVYYTVQFHNIYKIVSHPDLPTENKQGNLFGLITSVCINSPRSNYLVNSSGSIHFY